MKVEKVKSVVFVFDDDKADIKLLTMLLQKSNPDYEVIAAVSDDEIRELLNKKEIVPEIIFLDYQIPGKGGMQWLTELNTLNIAPVIMLTGQGDEITAAESIKKGAFDYIPKDTLTKLKIVKTIHNCRERWQVQKERDALLGIAAHELRNPLFAISGYTELLMDRENRMQPEELEKIYSIIYQSAAHLNEIVGSILNYSSIDKGKIKIRFTKTDLVLLVKSIIQTHTLLADKKNIKLNLLADSEECICELDRMRIEEVISNLIDNAVKYSPPDTAVNINIIRKTESAEINITDQGQGIKEHELRFLFELFSNVKISSRPTGGEKSTGLGLAISKKIVDLHNGKISVSSKPGSGSTFTVMLPLKNSN